MVTVGRRAYNLMYRFGAPGEDADRVGLRALVHDGRCAPGALRKPEAAVVRAIDARFGEAVEVLEAPRHGRPIGTWLLEQRR